MKKNKPQRTKHLKIKQLEAYIAEYNSELRDKTIYEYFGSLSAQAMGDIVQEYLNRFGTIRHTFDIGFSIKRKAIVSYNTCANMCYASIVDAQDAIELKETPEFKEYVGGYAYIFCNEIQFKPLRIQKI